MKLKEKKTIEYPAFINIQKEIKAQKIKWVNAAHFCKKLIKIPAKNNSQYFWIEGNFIFGDFFIQYIQSMNLDVDELHIISLSITHETIEALLALIENGWVKKINLILSGYFIRTEKIKHTHTIEILEKSVSDNFIVSVLNTHQKITLMKLKDGTKICMHGSANMKGSQNWEQFCIENNDYLYDFNLEMIKSVENG